MNNAPQSLTERFIKYYLDQDHKQTPDFGILPPPGDNSTHFITSGMQPLKLYYEGTLDPWHPSLSGSQTCLRLTDIDSVGVTNRHLTSFCMLGQFGWGLDDYDLPIRQSWNLLTQEFDLDPTKLHVTYYGGGVTDPDLTTRDIWRTIVSDVRIHSGGEDNFWRMGRSGPCGPCTEIYYELHEQPCGQTCSPAGCDCGRYLELYNLVLTQYSQTDSGLMPLPTKNLDTGMGLERLEMVMQGVDDIYSIKSFELERIQLQTCGVDLDSRQGRLIIDHLRTIRRMQKIGLKPGPKGSSYMLRRLMRNVFINGDLLEVIGLGSLFRGEPEEEHYRQMIQRGKKLLRKFPDPDEMTLKFLHETHGLPPEIINLINSERAGG